MLLMEIREGKEVLVVLEEEEEEETTYQLDKHVTNLLFLQFGYLKKALLNLKNTYWVFVKV